MSNHPGLMPTSRLTRKLGLWLAAVVALAFPLGFFGASYSALASSVAARAQVRAEVVTKLISTSPEMWRFEEHRLTELLVRLPSELPHEQARIIAPDGELIASSSQEAAAPYLRRSQPLFDAGDEVGQLEIRHSLRGMLGNTALVALVGLLLASMLAALLRQMERRERAIQQTLHDDQERARVTLDSIGDAVITTDLSQRIDYMNPVAERLTQWTLAEARGRPLAQVCPMIDESTLAAAPNPVARALQADQVTSLGIEAVALQRRDGTTLGIEESAAPLHAADGRVTGAALVFRDVTAARRMAQRITWAATHDALTGLVNRREFETRVETVITSAQAQQRQHVVCYIDLDQFKVVNDTCGHAAGDALLQQVCALLQARLSAHDTLARLGGDEFGVLLTDCTPQRAEAVAAELLETVREFRFLWDGKTFAVSASLGLVGIDADTRSRTEVFSAADNACYAAKEQGRNRICVFRSSDIDMNRRRSELDWASRLTDALAQDRFRLYYQPYRSLSEQGRGHRHIEILVRLLDEDGQLVPPGAFLPAAERYNLMPSIDRWIIRTVFARYHDLVAQMGAPLTCAINLSGTTLNSEGLLDEIRTLFERHRLPPGSICFEITETAVINNLRLVAQFMSALKTLGISFALDDFGVGTSSFAYLKTLPVDYLKIDGSFVRNIPHDPIDRAMTETINRIGHLMGLQTVGEFAESAEVIGELAAIGVDYAQGYGVQRPQPLPIVEVAATPSHLEPVAPAGTMCEAA